MEKEESKRERWSGGKKGGGGGKGGERESFTFSHQLMSLKWARSASDGEGTGEDILFAHPDTPGLCRMYRVGPHQTQTVSEAK